MTGQHVKGGWRCPRPSTLEADDLSRSESSVTDDVSLLWSGSAVIVHSLVQYQVPAADIETGMPFIPIPLATLYSETRRKSHIQQYQTPIKSLTIAGPVTSPRWSTIACGKLPQQYSIQPLHCGISSPPSRCTATAVAASGTRTRLHHRPHSDLSHICNNSAESDAPRVGGGPVTSLSVGPLEGAVIYSRQ